MIGIPGGAHNLELREPPLIPSPGHCHPSVQPFQFLPERLPFPDLEVKLLLE